MFSVTVVLRAYPKGPELLTVTEKYTNWRDADTAFCAYNVLCKLIPSVIQDVQFVEHRAERVHKRASKTSPTIIEGEVVQSCVSRLA
jgi:hypothetical protein